MEFVERQSLTENKVSSSRLLRTGSITAKFSLYFFMSQHPLLLTDQGFESACHPPRSGLRHGPGVPTDFPDQAKYAKDLKLLDLSNVVYHNIIPNETVIELLSQSDFQILATLHDTYGYSIIEGFSVATPAITTNVCALPEFVRHGENGYVLNLDLNERRHWNNWLHGDKVKTAEYWDIVNSTYEQLANKALQLILEFLDRQDKNEHYESLSAAALAQAKNFNLLSRNCPSS